MAIDPAELRTTADACRSLPSYGPEWDAAIAAGVDVTLIERNLRMSPVERIRHLDEINRWQTELRRRLPSPIASVHDSLRSDLETYGPERND
jgi:hypothetical protein